MAPNIEQALSLIDEGHSNDPRKTPNGEPYELHYAQRMTHYLNLHTSDASPLLQVAVRAQHFRRWEVPRDSYPKTKPGYFAWRTFLKKRQAEQVKEICLTCCFSEEEAGRVASLIAKEELKKGEGKGDAEAQVLEDCACLVFLVSTLCSMPPSARQAGSTERGTYSQRLGWRQATMPTESSFCARSLLTTCRTTNSMTMRSNGRRNMAVKRKRTRR